MRAEELMIGNYVHDEHGFQMQVCSIHDDGTVYCDFDGNEGDMWEFDEKNPPKGIEITHEELIKLGFVRAECGLGVFFKHSVYDGFRIWDSSETISKTFDVGRKDFELDLCIWIANTKHIHELQNLFYILTGKQLRYD